MKKVYVIHGWAGNSEKNWFPWLKKELEKRGVKTIVFDMPNTKYPKIEEWVKHLVENIKDIDEETYFIGYSVGCQTIIRFMEKLHKHKKIAGCFFIAPWFNLTNLRPKEMEIIRPWINDKIDFSRILDHCDNFVAMFSTNDPYVPISEQKIFKEKLNAKIIHENNQGHFEEEEEPEILSEILKFLKIH